LQLLLVFALQLLVRSPIVVVVVVVVVIVASCLLANY
jgi:hypothetical protein